MKTLIDPTRIFEIDGQVCPLLSAVGELAVGNNQSLVGALTGHIHLVMGWSVQGTTSTQPYFYLKSNSGGALITTRWTAPPSTAPPWDRPICDSGYGIKTASGHGLFIDVVTAALAIEVFYITYKA